jgi:hypothetical protein
MTEICFYLGDLKAQMLHNKPSDKAAFAQRYCEQIHSCMFVVGMPYAFVAEANHNRRSLVFCLMGSFKGIPENTELTAIDCFHMIEAICPTFPKALVLTTSTSLQRTGNVDLDGSNTVHNFKVLTLSVYISVLYEEWFKLISDYIAEESPLLVINVLKLKAKVEEFYYSMSPSICQPPIEILYSALSAVSPTSSASGITTSSFMTEVSLDGFRKALFTNAALEMEVMKIKNMQPNSFR